MKRFKRSTVKRKLQKVTAILRKLKVKFEVCGSYRRGKEDSKDIDILCTQESIGIAVNEIFRTLDITEKRWEGDWKTSFYLEGLPIDIKVVPEESWGAGLLHHTGTQAFNIKCRSIAKKKGMLLNEYGLLDRDTREPVVDGTTEEAILGMLFHPMAAAKYSDPKNRELEVPFPGMKKEKA